LRGCDEARLAPRRPARAVASGRQLRAKSLGASVQGTKKQSAHSTAGEEAVTGALLYEISRMQARAIPA
ncbi:MAG TPA: hypothetical protein VL242_20010, partial [Sorangium sp.]|nr:hypothetical protein [Sorangium sp.]